MFEVAIWKSLHSRLRNFSLDVSFRSSCKRIVLYGPSGSGKSLTLKAIAGLMKPDSGLIRLAGRTLFDSRNRIDIAPQERRLGYVFQNYALFPHLTVRQNIAFGRQRSSPANWFNPRHNRPDEKVDYWLQAFHLESVAGQYPEQLSGGQQQRTALARALLCEPQALLLDEPFSALDPDLRGMLRTELLELQTRLDLPMILITHDAEDVKAFAEETLRLEEGRCKSHRSNS